MEVFEISKVFGVSAKYGFAGGLYSCIIAGFPCFLFLACMAIMYFVYGVTFLFT